VLYTRKSLARVPFFEFQQGVSNDVGVAPVFIAQLNAVVRQRREEEVGPVQERIEIIGHYVNAGRKR
jgi:hypothetical protein